MNDGVHPQVEHWARYGRALGHAAANVVHEVNAPLAVALARVQLALRLLDQLSPEQAAPMDEQLRGCEAAIRASATVIRDLNYLRRDLDRRSDSTSVIHVVSAAYQLALLDATHAGCEIKLHVPRRTVNVASDAQGLLVLLLELLWDRIANGARKVWLEVYGIEQEAGATVRIVVASDLLYPCDSRYESWIDSLVTSSGGTIAWQKDDRGRHACLIELPQVSEHPLSPWIAAQS